MKRITALLVLLGIAAGCGGLKRRALVPQPYPTRAQEYLAGFMDGYRGAHPLDPHAGDSQGYSPATAYRQGLRDGYLTGRKDEMVRK